MLNDVVIALKNEKANTNKSSVHRTVLLDLIEFKYLPIKYL